MPERPEEFQGHVVAAMEEVVATHPRQRVAVVCHGGVINAYLSSVIHLPGTMFFEPAYTSVSRVISGSTHRQIVSVNVSKADNQITEIELWRGDNQPILSVPKQADLWEMHPGRVYSPRG